MDQTGIHLVPSASWTWEQKGAAAVPVVGAEDKRQITACLSSSLYGDLLPLQLIFQGTTPRCLPPVTANSLTAGVHCTYTQNHWSSLETMKQWMLKVLLPYAERQIKLHSLDADAHIVLVLDAWSVHRSEEFRMHMRNAHPRVHLVFVPANCTSRLQVADVALQRPFKHAIRSSFEAWAAQEMLRQIKEEKIIGFSQFFHMCNVKPQVLQWCIDSWNQLNARKSVIANGWYKACTSLYNLNELDKRVAAWREAEEQKVDVEFVPNEDEQEPSTTADGESDHEENEEKDELDLSRPIPEPERRSERGKRQRIRPEGEIDPNYVGVLTSESEQEPAAKKPKRRERSRRR
jgi:hypothetical protein